MTEFVCPFSNDPDVAHVNLTVDGMNVSASGVNRLGDFTKGCLLRSRLEGTPMGKLPDFGEEVCPRCNRRVKYDLRVANN